MKIKKKLPTLLRYLDTFGTKLSFYNKEKPRLYTKTGGILSIISILGSLLTFIIFSLDDLNRISPLSTTSSLYDIPRKIKFGKEKIWIPWRIVDYNNNNYINHTGLLFPIIYYYTGYRDKVTNNFNSTTKILNYELCNKTSMANNSSIYKLPVPLNEIYCIDMDDLDMGGSWIGDFIHYVQFDLYFCEDGIDFDATNSKCTSNNNITNFLGENNSLQIDIYYPSIEYQPTNKTYPLTIFYRQSFYHLSRYSFKIERIYLQQHILTDDLGWIGKKESHYSYWGLNTINEDSYFIGTDRDLMNEGSTSRAYSVNIYLKSEKILYKRYYKKLQYIVSEFFPIAYIIFIIMKSISKIFKNAESNQKSMELLFERIKEKPLFSKTIQQLKINSNSKNNLLSNNKENDKKYENNNKYINLYIGPKVNDDEDINQKIKKQINSSSLVLNNNFSKNSNNNITSNLNRGTNCVPLSFFSNNTLTKIHHSKQSLIIHEKIPALNISKIVRNIKPTQKNKEQKRIIREKLFPYKYYFYSVFIKNLDISHKKKFFFSMHFSKIYIFMSKLFDITTYLTLQREFHNLKKILKESQIKSIEDNKKININSPGFIVKMNECLDNNKFHILAL